MTPEDFVSGLASGGGMDFAEDDPRWCLTHNGWAAFCPAFDSEDDQVCEHPDQIKEEGN